MTSRDVYKVLHKELGPIAKQLGFRRERTMLSYSRPEGQESLCFWFQCDKPLLDLRYGSKLTCEFQLAVQSKPGHGMKRERFGKLLSPEEWSALCAMNLAVKKKQKDYLRGTIYGGGLTEHHPPPYLSDFWIDYKDPEDVVLAAEFIAPRVVTWIDKFLLIVSEKA